MSWSVCCFDLDFWSSISSRIDWFGVQVVLSGVFVLFFEPYLFVVFVEALILFSLFY